MYISSLIPSERGIQLSLEQCYYGDEDHDPVGAFITAMDSMPDLWKVARKIEGIITRLGIHAAGAILSNEPITEYNSLMRTSKGWLVTAYDLHDSEYLGEVKYDFLSIDGLGKINAAINFMLKDEIIEWKGSLKETYKNYLWPDKLKYNEELWQNIANNEINSLWQLNTDVGTQALANIHATSLKEIGMINSLMRLQPQNRGDEQPLRTFERFRDNISEWYQEMHAFGLDEKEVNILEEHLLILNGVADTQESVMQLVMDPRISDFNIAEANKLRKGIAKKSVQAQEEAKTLFYSKGKENGASRQILNYIWDVQISRQLGYSFSLPHVAAYSIIAMQQANLYTYYPSIYWNTACLSIDAGANQEEDLQDLIKKGYIKASISKSEDFEEEDEEGTRTIDSTKIDRGKVAAAIGTFQKTMHIEPPDINTSGFGFVPDYQNNAITCGLKLVSYIGDQLIYNIIFNRPYVSFDDFIDRVSISKNRVVNLIKADAFRRIDKRDRMTLLKHFVREQSNPKKKLTLQNLQMLIGYDLIPAEFNSQKQVFMWVKYIRKSRHENYYKLDERALVFYEKVLDPSKLINMNIKGEYSTLIDSKYVDNFYQSQMNKIKAYIKENHNELLNQLNENLFLDEWKKYKMDNLSEGEMQSMRMYVSKHELADITLDYEISDFETMEEEEDDGHFYIEGKFIPRYKIRHIVGTVIDKNKTKHKIIVLTPSGPAEVKIWKNQFSFYDQTLIDPNVEEKTILQDSFFEIGTHLMLTGFKRGNSFVLKKYKVTKVEDVIMKINLKQGDIEIESKLKQEDIHS